MSLSEKDALEQTIKDREERIAQSTKDRRNRTIVASIAAVASILAACAVALKGIDKFSETKSSYQIVTGPGSLDPGQNVGVYLLDSKTDETWFARRTLKGADWVPILFSGPTHPPKGDASPTPSPFPSPTPSGPSPAN